VGRIAFGSCNTPSRDGLWGVLRDKQPDKLVLLGDNIYADSKGLLYGHVGAEVSYIRGQYEALFRGEAWSQLLQQVGGLTNVMATYDDHDYGIDNGDSTYPHREASMQLFFEYFQPHMRNTHRNSGVYSSSSFALGGLQIKTILLDTRYNKSPNSLGPDGDFLGENQWAWLTKELLDDKKSDVILLGSSIQVLADDKLLEENWGQFPEARSRLLKLILSSPSKNIFLLSGDVHYAEFTEVQ